MPAATSSVNISLTVISVATLGPLAGPYALIVFAALAGALWPLSSAETPTRRAGAWLLLRCTLTAVVMTVFLARLAEASWGIPVHESLAPVALLIGAMGNGWRAVFANLGKTLQAVAGRSMEGKQ